MNDRIKPIFRFSIAGWKPLLIITTHICCWLLYISIELIVLVNYHQRLEPAGVYLTFYSLNIGLCYAVIWALAAIRNWWFTASRVTLVVASYLFLKWLATGFLYSWVTVWPLSAGQIKNLVITTLYRGYPFLIIGLFYRLAGYAASYRKQAHAAEKRAWLIRQEKLELEHKLLEIQNAYLQQQLNPHLVFNTLTLIYAQIYRHSAPAAHALQLLTEILRYTVLQNGHLRQVALSEELAHLEKLIELNQCRFEHPLQLDFRVGGPIQQFDIIPLILLTLTENIFKHGQLQNNAHPAQLVIQVSPAGRLRFRSTNLKKDKTADYKHGIGLHNIRRRLVYSYPDRHQLVINETATKFEVQLYVDLDSAETVA